MATPIISPILPLNIEGQELTPVDESSVASINLPSTFDTTVDYVQAYLYDSNNNVITRLTTNYSVISGNVSGSSVTQLTLDPATDLQKNNYTQGNYNINYNFLSPLVENNPLFKIQEISSTRTELRINNSSLNITQTQQIVDSINSYLANTAAFQGYYLDFGLDTILLAVNIAIDNNTILVKLYEPLPDAFAISNTFTLVKKKGEPVAYNVTFPQEETLVDSTTYLKGPNFSIKNSQQTNTSTEYQTYGSLFNGTTPLTNQLRSVLAERRAELNTDYTNYSNFAFFSSAQQRLINFYYKASLIENYTNQINTLNSLVVSTEVSASKAVYQEKINELIINFDGYDYFLYFDSGSKSWPKSNSTKPYTLYGSGSTETLTWYTEQLNSASLYDEQNQNYIYNIYPSYITEDSDNSQFQLFNEMVAQMFDQVWLYTKAIENRQDGDNRLSEGISIDLAADALRSYGITLYESNFANVDLYTTYLGITPEGSTLPPTGSELITNYITASADTTPFNEAQKLIYKRLYHNLPYILKKKGTTSGLRVLLNCFGIPDTLIRINEFGGKDKNAQTWDNWQYQFNYSYNATGSNYISSSFVLNPTWGVSTNRPSSIAFRFKPETNYPTTSSQNLWSLDTGQVKLVLEYTGSGLTSGSYSGSITNPYNKYGTLKFIINSNTSASVYLPFFNGDWWSVLITSGSTQGYNLYAKSNTFGNTVNNNLGFQASSSINTTTNWSGSTTSYFGNVFSGSLQEIRYYKTVLNESTFNDYVMNPYSIEGNSINTSANELVFRANLGGELYTGSTSTHPKSSGIWSTTSSFVGTSNFYYNTTPNFSPNYEYIYFDQVAAGIQNPVSNKITNTDIVLPTTESTAYNSNKILSTYITVEQNREENTKYTPDVNYVEIALSPTNEINEDINSSLGYFNIGEFIGDPREISSSAYSYPALNSLSQTYFEKYNQTYNWTDFLRIIKYFDNSVFRMLKDFIPARAGVATGAVIKQHLLERNRQRPAQVTYSEPYYTGSVTSLARNYQTGSIEVFTGGAGGSVNVLTNISQSWTSSLFTKAGIVTNIQSSEYEFFNGEYSGSKVECQLSYSLNTTPLLNNVSSSRLSSIYEDIDYSSDGFNPVNLAFIQSGSAYLAAVQDSNYARTGSWSALRYEGIKNRGSYNTTILFSSQSIAQGYPVDFFTPYFLYYDWIGGANPQYPSGGNVHCIYLINAETREIYNLTTENRYVNLVSTIFKAGTPTYGITLGQNFINAPNFTSTVVEGGALYDTVLYKSGSNSANEGFIANYASRQPAYTASFSITSNGLTDSGTANVGWLYALNTTSSSADGILDPIRSYGIPSGSNVGIYNKRTGQYITASPYPFIQGALSSSIAYEDTYLPLLPNDFIRFGYDPASPFSVDQAFNTGISTRIKTISLGTDNNIVSTLSIIDLNSIPVAARQNYRIFRRIPNETFVLINNLPYGGPGLLLPYNFNPKYNPVEIFGSLGLQI